MKKISGERKALSYSRINVEEMAEIGKSSLDIQDSDFFFQKKGIDTKNDSQMYKKHPHSSKVIYLSIRY
jgi:hypothetical protein